MDGSAARTIGVWAIRSGGICWSPIWWSSCIGWQQRNSRRLTPACGTIKLPVSQKGRKLYITWFSVIQIQEEYNQLILDGIQQARLLSLLRTANLQLPDFQWLQAEMLNPGETFVKMLEMDWQDTTTQFQRMKTVLNLLKTTLFHRHFPDFHKNVGHFGEGIWREEIHSEN